MSENIESIPLPDRFRDSRDILDTQLAELRRQRRIRSAAKLAIISQMRAGVHDQVNLFRDFYVGTVEAGTEPLREELAASESALMRWATMRAHDEFRTVDLARVENLGDWEATADVEREIAAIAEQLRAAQDGGDVIDRHEPAARRRITVDPLLVTTRGLVAVRRKRLMLATAPRDVQFQDARRPKDAGAMVATTHVEIDKVSEFVLDLKLLGRMSPKAAREVEDAILHGGNANAFRVMREIFRYTNPLTAQDPNFVVPDASAAELTNHGDELVSPRFIEAAIDARHEVLTPAVTTYYADRKFRDIRPAGNEGLDAESRELIDAY